LIDSKSTRLNTGEIEDKKKIRVLFLSASPEERDKLQVIDECNSVEYKIKSARYSRLFDFRQSHEFSITNLQEYLIDQDPQILHFSGHGDEDGVILFQEGEERKASVKAIANLFKILNESKNPNNEKNRIQCVVLNACFSKKLAKAIAKYVDCVIGMSKEVRDDAAKVFAQSLYYSLASGHDVETAFKLGRNNIEISDIPGEHVPSLVAQEGVDPKKVILVGATHATVTTTTLATTEEPVPKPEPVHKREYHTFLSRACVDKTIANNLYEWLRDAIRDAKGNDHVYYDEPKLGINRSTILAEKIHECRSITILLSKNSVSKGWVKEQYDTAIGQKALFDDFNIIPVLIEECEVPGFIDKESLIELRDGRLNLDTSKEILGRIYYRERAGPGPDQAKDLYISRGWRDQEKPFAEYICELLDKAGFRLIGEAEDRASEQEEDIEQMIIRIKTIMSSCGGFVAIVPYRAEEKEYKTSKYVVDEIGIAQSIQLPSLIIAEPGVYLPKKLANYSLPLQMETAKGSSHETLQREIKRIGKEWKNPHKRHYVLFATNFKNKKRNNIIRDHIELITSMKCETALDYRDKLRESITKKITDAFLVVADISDNNPNTLIEAGIALGAIARGASTSLRLVARSKDERYSPPYMLDNIQIESYADDNELLAKVHKIAYEFRRRILNYELVINMQT
jgi:TIR domain/CHAT domain